jgi:hypothetical protein
MLTNIISAVKDIFVGRENELATFRDIWQLTNRSGEHFVYVVLNAPGTGKTTLIEHFGNDIEQKKEGLFIKWKCSDFNSTDRMNRHILTRLRQVLIEKRSYLKEFSTSIVQLPGSSVTIDLSKVVADIDVLFQGKLISRLDVRDVFQHVSNLIPLFFAADEIQELQKFTMDGKPPDGKETGLHYFTRFLKDLIDSRILVVLSGTRYHVLSQIGFTIGSPIRQKVKALVISRFSDGEIVEYTERVRAIIESNRNSLGMKKEHDQPLLDNYRVFLQGFSGGHPRTISTITERFLASIPAIADDAKTLDYEGFMKRLLPDVEQELASAIASAEMKQALLALGASSKYPVVQAWLLHGAWNGLALGNVPRDSSDGTLDEEINKIVFELVNLGFIMQNGNKVYYWTSYFHLIAFLNVFNKEHEEFLHQVLHNKYFQLLVGRDAGFGYTFENILIASMLRARGSEQKALQKRGKPIAVPVNLAAIRTARVIPRQVDWTASAMEHDVLYQTPAARGFDFVVFQNDTLVMAQVFTGNPPDPKKIDKLQAEMQRVPKDACTRLGFHRILGWVISLHEFKQPPRLDGAMTVTSGDALVPLLGESMVTKLLAIKNAFGNALP